MATLATVIGLAILPVGLLCSVALFVLGCYLWARERDSQEDEYPYERIHEEAE